MNSCAVSFDDSTPPKHHWRWVIPLPLVAIAIAVIYSQLRFLPAESLDHIALGLMVILCALAGLGMFLGGVHWGVSRDEKLMEANFQLPVDSGEGEEIRPKGE